MKADCCVAYCHLCTGQKDAFEHTAKTAADGQLALTFCPCLRGSNSLYHWGVVVYILKLNRENCKIIVLVLDISIKCFLLLAAVL